MSEVIFIAIATAALALGVVLYIGFCWGYRNGEADAEMACGAAFQRRREEELTYSRN